jgi:hypothetical protein
MRHELNESIKSVIARTTYSSVNEATKKDLQPVTRIFGRFIKKEILPYLQQQTGMEWTLSEYRESMGVWDNMVKYRAYSRTGNDSFYIYWDITARDGGKFELRISGEKNSRNIAYAYYNESASLSAADFKSLKKMVPDQIISGFKTAMSGSYTQEIDNIKRYVKEMNEALAELTKNVKDYTDLVNKGLKASDPRKGLAAQQAKLARMHYNMSGRSIESNARYISEQVDIIAQGK